MSSGVRHFFQEWGPKARFLACSPLQSHQAYENASCQVRTTVKLQALCPVGDEVSVTMKEYTDSTVRR